MRCEGIHRTGVEQWLSKIDQFDWSQIVTGSFLRKAGAWRLAQINASNDHRFS